jgi:flagellin
MISINYNGASSAAAYNLANTNTKLQRSLQKLSSGSRINSSYDDAGGLAVSMKLSASIRRTEATQINVNNAISFLQTQDGVLKAAGSVLSRLAELAQLSADVTKSNDDKSLYQTEYNSLTSSLNSMLSSEFNGTALVSSSVSTMSVVITEDGAGTVAINRSNLNTDILNSIGISLTTGNISTHIETLDTAIQALGDLRAQNGAEQMRLTFAADILAINKTNLESANSRIADVDVAAESTNLARLSILQNAGAAMLAQANQSNQSILRLLV